MRAEGKKTRQRRRGGGRGRRPEAPPSPVSPLDRAGEKERWERRRTETQKLRNR
ncbi:hypothetical protein U1Q18_007495, partial [Sarracenia purpurea var. burkii]